ncbi:hypothetical protein EG328_000807 [Venturia inaequalis]|uniref:DUF7165 domain-containing protein n=2 Tax=Venturia inaequalis TaxID=5025 RepID=A0A8H3VRZ0_VENIN|nr:hypothetical protein EG328_000807 [Venturia inaequalis]KAE9992961.1 hypothetical protein EG327_007096 [Venturia inaequalis]
MERDGDGLADTIQQWNNGPTLEFPRGRERTREAMATLAYSLPATSDMTDNPLRPSAVGGTRSSDGTTQYSDSGMSEEGSTRTTIVELVSTSATSSAFPESFGLSISMKGKWIAAYSSSALYLLSVENLPAFEDSCRGFRIRRKPLAVAVTDVGKFAVLTTPHKIDIYKCGEEHGDFLLGRCRKLETVYLNNDARNLAFSFCGEVVAAGSDTGIEIRNLCADAIETDMRQINTSSLDYISFSEDGKSLLATASARRARVSTFISLNEGFGDAYMDEAPPEEVPLGKTWITQLLFPERMNARQAVFLPESANGPVNALLAFDSHSDRYRVYDVALKRFTKQELSVPFGVRWSRSDRLEDALPAVSGDASCAAIAVRLKSGRELWVYNIPTRWREGDIDEDPDGEHNEEHEISPLRRVPLPAREDGTPPESITYLRWLQNSHAPTGRLVALVSTVTLAMPEEAVPIEAPAASGKVMLFDMKHAASESDNVTTNTLIINLDHIELHEGLTDEVLELDREVDIVRRRTQVQRQRPDPTVLPGPRTPRRSVSSGSTGSGLFTLRDLNRNRSGRRRRSVGSMSSMSEDTDNTGPVAAVDEPYSQQQPRSQFSLHRAATMAANSTANRNHLRALPTRPLEYRRADGLREMPHESDADNWVPPPPPYTAEPDNTISLPISPSPGLATGYAAIVPGLPLQIPQIPPPPLPPLPPSSPAAPLSMPAIPVSVPLLSPMASPPSAPVQESIAPRQRPHSVGMSPGSIPSPQRIPRRPVNPRQTPESSQHAPSPLTPPMPGFLNSPMTFPPAGNPPQGSMLDSSISRKDREPSGMTESTPASPATRIRRDSAGRHSPIPSADQLMSLHRRSGSGGSAPRAALGAFNQDSPRRPSSIERQPPLPSLSPQQESPRRSSENALANRGSPASRTQQRPSLNRLATITSIASHPPNTDDPIGEVHTRSAHTTPETPTGGRRHWYRRGGGQKDSPGENRAAAVGTSSHRTSLKAVETRPKEKESSFKCIVM